MSLRGDHIQLASMDMGAGALGEVRVRLVLSCRRQAHCEAELVGVLGFITQRHSFQDYGDPRRSHVLEHQLASTVSDGMACHQRWR